MIAGWRSQTVLDLRRLLVDGFEGSIHQAGRHLMGGSPCNGWEHWYYEDESGALHTIDDLRQRIREAIDQPSTDR